MNCIANQIQIIFLCFFALGDIQKIELLYEYTIELVKFVDSWGNILSTIID
jgi:hypothetical protein